MTALTTLPAPAAVTQTGIPVKTGPGADTAAGFGDALLALLAGPAPAAPADLAPATEEGAPQEITPPVFDFSQSAPAQLALPSSVPAPDPDPVPVQDAPVNPLNPVNPLPASAQALPADPAAPGAAPVTPAPSRAATGTPAAPAQALPADPGAVQTAAATQAPAQVLPAAPATQPGTRAVAAAPRQGTPPPPTAAAPAVPFLPAPVGAEQVIVPTAPAAAAPISQASAAPGPVPAKMEALAAAPRLSGEPAPAAFPAPALPPAPAPVALPVTAPPAPAVPVPAGYTAQLAKPVFSLATAGPGEHTMTVQVNPEKLGPVTVQAHVSAGNVRIELFAATADGRDVLRQSMPELRRDLAGAGITASLDLSSNGGSPHGGHDRETFTRRAPASNHPGSNGRPLHMNDQIARTRPAAYGPETVLDVMA